ncbi:hypothetical protein [Acidithiobacillus sp.]
MLDTSPGILRTGQPPKKPGATMSNLNAISLIFIYAALPLLHALGVLVWALRQRKEARHGK